MGKVRRSAFVTPRIFSMSGNLHGQWHISSHLTSIYLAAGSCTPVRRGAHNEIMRLGVGSKWDLNQNLTGSLDAAGSLPTHPSPLRYRYCHPIRGVRRRGPSMCITPSSGLATS